eukprot:CAMPEP_0178379412 /NCGR_PEP_ID=MMETSP0689_2-20121128/4929_1 /TAXON_ID=160604 /ORGANISM="Amphidinium massartii, Strain CS-259" /LENGTH=437 /DNA_ID=CAMNT_0019999513 /DNA_START=169 /DNA_END=1482 /DNA_ORIENTATION=+
MRSPRVAPHQPQQTVQPQQVAGCRATPSHPHPRVSQHSHSCSPPSRAAPAAANDVGYDAMVRRTSRSTEVAHDAGESSSPQSGCDEVAVASEPANVPKRDRSADSTARWDHTRRLPASKVLAEPPLSSRRPRLGHRVEGGTPRVSAQAWTQASTEAGGRRLPRMASKDRGQSHTPRAPAPHRRAPVGSSQRQCPSPPEEEALRRRAGSREAATAVGIPRLPGQSRNHPAVMKTQKIANIYGVALPASQPKAADSGTSKSQVVAVLPQTAQPCPFPGLAPLADLACANVAAGVLGNIDFLAALKTTIRHQRLDDDEEEEDAKAAPLSPGSDDGHTHGAIGVADGAYMEVDNKVRRPPSESEDDRRIKSYSPPPHRRLHEHRPHALQCKHGVASQASGPASAPAATEEVKLYPAARFLSGGRQTPRVASAQMKAPAGGV